MYWFQTKPRCSPSFFFPYAWMQNPRKQEMNGNARSLSAPVNATIASQISFVPRLGRKSDSRPLVGKCECIVAMLFLGQGSWTGAGGCGSLPVQLLQCLPLSVPAMSMLRSRAVNSCSNSLCRTQRSTHSSPLSIFYVSCLHPVREQDVLVYIVLPSWSVALRWSNTLANFLK